MGPMSRVRCIVFNAALGALDYRVPAGMDAPPGSVVVLPLGPRQILGVVWDDGELPGDDYPEHKLRAVLEALPVPPLPAPLRRLISWCADYYLAPLSAVARMALSSSAALKGSGTVTEYRLTGEEPARMTPQRLQALDLLQGEQATMRELTEIAGVSEAVLRGMLGQGLLEPVLVDSDRPYPEPDPRFAVPDLAEQQAEAAAEMVAAVEAHRFQPFLLDGVTGSGKTETYFEAVAAALEAGRQVLVLLPEIALTAAFLSRFRKAVRDPARHLAFLAQGIGAAAGVAAGGVRRRESRGRRALGVVPAVCRSRADRRRRSARDRVQAG